MTERTTSAEDTQNQHCQCVRTIVDNIKLNLEMKTITINGQIFAKTDDNGTLKYNKCEDVDEKVQELMAKWLKKSRHDCEQSCKRDEMKKQQQRID